jgi:3-hydroxybutyryl-CoA dehydrogenase
MNKSAVPANLPDGGLPDGGLPDFVGVLGGGRMGAGIAHAFLINGANVLVVERDEQSAEAARERVESAAAKSIERGATDGNLDEMASRLAVTVDYDDFKDRQLVIEAVPEDWDLKVSSLRGIEERLAADAYLASNTSSLSVNGLARELKRPQNFLGLHFFNPVPASTLIEVVLGEQTAETLALAARGWVEALGKTAVVVNDAPGFASSRLGVAIALEAMRMVEEGVASRPWCWATNTPPVRCGPPTLWAWTSDWASPSTWPPRWVNASRRRRSSATRWRAVNSDASPAKASSTGPTEPAVM